MKREVRIDELPPYYRDQLRKKLKDQADLPGKAPYVEPHNRDEPIRAKEAPRLNGPHCIRILEYRHRLTDFGGGSEKYLVDALVTAGIFKDDSLKEVCKIEREAPIKIPTSEEERTIVEIYSQEPASQLALTGSWSSLTGLEP